MQKLFFMSFAAILFCTACTRLPVSKYADSNVIKYERGQPSIHFSNERLNIKGAWWWASSSRVMPNPNYLPRELRRMFRPISKEHGKVLFATFSKDQKKFLRSSDYVPVLKADVRYDNPNHTDYYITVLISEKPFNEQNKKYIPKGRAQDFEFRLFQANPVRVSDKWVIMEVIASHKDRYFTFACILDQNLEKDQDALDWQAERFFEDAKVYLSEAKAD